MSDLFRYALELDWSAVITAASTAALAIAAFRALGAWKSQISVQRKLECMDRLSASVDEMINLLSPAVQFAAWIPKTIDSYKKSIHVQSSETPHKIPAYLKDRGKRDAEMLAQYLSPCAGAAITMQSSLRKGQAMKLKNFESCSNACQRILWVYQRLSGVREVLQSSLYWPNPDVQQSLTNILSIDAEDLVQQINGAESNVTIFLVANYEAMGLAR